MQMRKYFLLIFALVTIAGLGQTAHAEKNLSSRVNESFRQVYGSNPTPTENLYWLGRVVRKEKTSYTALVGAMAYHKARGTRVGSVSTSKKVNGTSTTAATAATKQQLIKDVLPLFVEIYGNDPANAEKVWWRKRISCNELASKDALVNSMRYHKSKQARKGKDTICGQAATAAVKNSSGVTRRAVAGISDHVMGDQVRIGITNTNGEAFSISADGKFQVREGASKILATVGKDDVVKVSWSDGKYHVRGSGLSFDTANKIRLVPLNQAVMEIQNYADKSTTIAGKNYNRFRGIIEIRKCDGCGELWAINELRTEYYLRGLAETSGTGPEEFIKALGIAARTYVLYHKVVTGGAADLLYQGESTSPMAQTSPSHKALH